MSKMVTIAKRMDSTEDTFGKSGSPKYYILGIFHAAEDFNKGTKALREGAFDAYDTVMFRMRYNQDIDRWCLIQYKGKWYQITSFNTDFQTNQTQITAIEMSNQTVNIIDVSNSDL